MNYNISEEDIKKWRKRVKLLQKKPQPEQRTKEWYESRYKRITASEAASCLFKSKGACEAYVQQFDIKNFKYKDTEPLNSYETREDYIIKKCRGFYGENLFKDTIYTLWGKKYEEVANRLYSQLNNTKVIEFGLVSHPKLNWLAASPDGITPDGIMLEIKCPKSRKIDETSIPIYYYIQTQIQMETVNLDYCDFFECEIIELETEDEFVKINVGEKQAKGIILQIVDSGPDPKFVYPPIEITETNDYIIWKNKMINENPDTFNDDVVRQQGIYIPIYFFIEKYHNQRIKRSKEGNGLGYGFVTFFEMQSAMGALSLDGTVILGRPVK